MQESMDQETRVRSQTKLSIGSLKSSLTSSRLSNDGSDCDSGFDSSSSIRAVRLATGLCGDRASSSSSSSVINDDVINAVHIVPPSIRSKTVTSSRGPIKADHRIGVLLQNQLQQHRRNYGCPPQPKISQTSSLTSLPGSNDAPLQRVRFDDGLRLSEQSLRSSCRKLFSKVPMAGYVPARESQGGHPNQGTITRRQQRPPPASSSRARNLIKARSIATLNHQNKKNMTSKNTISGSGVKKSTSCLELSKKTDDVIKDEKNQCVIYSKDMINVYARLAAVPPAKMPDFCTSGCPVEYRRSICAGNMGDLGSRGQYRASVSVCEQLCDGNNRTFNCKRLSGSFAPGTCDLGQGAIQKLSKEYTGQNHSTIINPRDAIQYNTKMQVESQVRDPIEMKQCFSCSDLDSMPNSSCRPKDKASNINHSNLDIFRGDAKKRNLITRFQGLKNSAKSVVLRAFLQEKPKVSKQTDSPRSQGLIGTLRNSFRRKKRPQTRNDQAAERNVIDSSAKSASGHILHFHANGSQNIEVYNHANPTPLFTVARTKHNGILVTRLKDLDTRKQLMGLLDIGDQILEIDGKPVGSLNMTTINGILSHRQKINLKIMPFMHIPL